MAEVQLKVLQTQGAQPDTKATLEALAAQNNDMRTRMIELEASITDQRTVYAALITKLEADRAELKAGLDALIAKLNADGGITDTDYATGLTDGNYGTAITDALDADDATSPSDFTDLDTFVV